MQQDQLIGKRINDFIIQERVGRGAHSLVYRAYQSAISRDVALKLIRIGTETGQDEDFRARFEREARILAALEHIHILPVYDYGIDGNMAFLAMRLVRGGSLADYLNEKGVLDLNETAHILSQVARALSYAHARGIIHRDLKPENVLMDDSGNAFLTDFGLAKRLLGSEVISSKERALIGTPTYMSPEQIGGEDLTETSDVYSMGVMLYRMISGRLPFELEGDVMSVLQRHLYEAPTPPRDHNPEIPPSVQQVILRAMAKVPTQRYDSVDELMLNLNAALGSLFEGVRISDRLPDTTTGIHQEVREAIEGRENPTFRRLAPVVLGITAVFVMLALVILFLRTPQPVPIINSGMSTSATNITPQAGLIRRARRVLGQDGFIAYIACNRTSEFHATRAREMVDFAANYGLDLRIYDSNSDPSLEVAKVEEARGDGARAIIPCILNQETILPSLQAAQAAGIPIVVSGDGLIDQLEAVFVAGDNYQLGEVVGEYAGRYVQSELNGEAEVVVLDFPDVDEIVQRADGLEAGLLAVVPGVTVIGRYRGATQGFGMRSVEELLEEDVSFNVILSINDAGSYGAIDAMAEAGIPPDAVHVFSIDAEQLARQYIEDGYFMRASLNLDREEGSQAMVNAVVILLGGGEIAERVITPPGTLYTAQGGS